jgi:hypothetical protein
MGKEKEAYFCARTEAEKRTIRKMAQSNRSDQKSMKARVKQIYAALDRFIRNYKKSHQIKYIRLKPNDYQLLIESLSYYQQLIANKKGYIDYRDFTVIPEK